MNELAVDLHQEKRRLTTLRPPFLQGWEQETVGQLHASKRAQKHTFGSKWDQCSPSLLHSIKSTSSSNCSGINRRWAYPLGSEAARFVKQQDCKSCGGKEVKRLCYPSSCSEIRRCWALPLAAWFMEQHFL
eukprot:1146089-Pelagomonas_calceolata.AAC.2